MAINLAALLADEAPDAAIITTAEGEVLHWNKGAESIFGYTQAEALGRSVHELIIPDNRHDVGSSFTLVLAER
jgi:PAS domain S-box-containing protein